MSPGIPYLDAARLSAMLTPAEALQAVQAFFAEHGRDQVATPTRIHMPVPGQDTLGLYMPAASGHYVGLKVVHLMPSRFPSVAAEVFLYRADTAQLLFWGDGGPLTALRTAAVSIAASLHLLAQCRHAVVFGAGVQAASHIVALADAYPELERVEVIARSPASYERLHAGLPRNVAGRCQPCARPGDALGAADCVIATTPSAEPLFHSGALRADVHVVGIGSATHAMNELPPSLFSAAEVWLDTPAAVEEAGDLRAALRSGWTAAQMRGDLFDLLGADGPQPPTARTGRTLFKSVGHAAQDLAILVRLYELMQSS